MTAEELAQRALDYRDGNIGFARYDLQAAIDGVPGAVSRLGSDKALLTEAKEILTKRILDDVLGMFRLEGLR